MRPTARPCEPGDRRWVEGLLEEHLGSTRVARLGEVIEVPDLPGFIAERGGERLGLLTWIVDGDQLEVLSLHCRVENVGAGGVLLQAAAELAAGRGCRRLWLLTTNDNLHALGFYQRRGLRLCALHAGAVERDRALKPEAPRSTRATGSRCATSSSWSCRSGSGRRCGGTNAWPVKRPGGGGMGSDHTPADDIVYDLVSIQYHALKAGQTYTEYIEDAEGHDDVRTSSARSRRRTRPSAATKPPHPADQGRRHRLTSGGADGPRRKAGPRLAACCMPMPCGWPWPPAAATSSSRACPTRVSVVSSRRRWRRRSGRPSGSPWPGRPRRP